MQLSKLQTMSIVLVCFGTAHLVVSLEPQRTKGPEIRSWHHERQTSPECQEFGISLRKLDIAKRGISMTT